MQFRFIVVIHSSDIEIQLPKSAPVTYNREQLKLKESLCEWCGFDSSCTMNIEEVLSFFIYPDTLHHDHTESKDYAIKRCFVNILLNNQWSPVYNGKNDELQYEFCKMLYIYRVIINIKIPHSANIDISIKNILLSEKSDINIIQLKEISTTLIDTISPTLKTKLIK